MRLANPSGGLLWHWRAWRSQARWAATTAQIAAWLQQVHPQSDELLLIGASAGWMLPSAWLQQFKKIEIWDLDVWAPLFFSHRHGRTLKKAGVSWHYHRGDALQQLPQLLQNQPQALVFFDNVLGQLRFMSAHRNSVQQVQQTEQRLREIVQQLQGRHWASIHDRLSGPVDSLTAARAMPSTRSTTVPSEARQQMRLDRAWLNVLGAQGEWLDHLTASVFAPGQTVRDLAWPFKADYWHWLQAGEVRA